MGKVVVVTGGSSGIGAAAARALRAAGAHVVITGRSPETQRFGAEIDADAYLVDYTRFAEVRGFAERLLAKYSRIDALVNNVGGIFGERRITPDGHEMTLQVNHLSGFLLTNLLRDRLEASQAVVVNTASAANRFGRIDFDDLESTRAYNPMRAYATSKLMNILHAMEVTRRFDGVPAASFHPGGVATGFARDGRGVVRWIYQGPLKRLFLISPEKSIDTLLWLLQGVPTRDWTPGEYYYKRKPGRRSAQATPTVAQPLWEASVELLGSAG